MSYAVLLIETTQDPWSVKDAGCPEYLEEVFFFFEYSSVLNVKPCTPSDYLTKPLDTTEGMGHIYQGLNSIPTIHI